eukprot:gene11560-4808_t
MEQIKEQYETEKEFYLFEQNKLEHHLELAQDKIMTLTKKLEISRSEEEEIDLDEIILNCEILTSKYLWKKPTPQEFRDKVFTSENLRPMALKNEEYEKKIEKLKLQLQQYVDLSEHTKNWIEKKKNFN